MRKVYIWAVLLLNNTPKHSKPKTKKIHSTSQTANIPTKATVKSKNQRQQKHVPKQTFVHLTEFLRVPHPIAESCRPGGARRCDWVTSRVPASTGLADKPEHSGTPLSKPLSKDWLVGWITCFNAKLSLKRSLAGTEIPGGEGRGRLYLTLL